MTMGPEPMTRMRLMEVSLGMSVGAARGDGGSEIEDGVFVEGKAYDLGAFRVAGSAGS